jgi:7-cyano-7-deazaguanine reductase
MSGRKDEELEGVSLLGTNKTDYEVVYNPKLLEAFPNKNPGRDQWVSFVCTEFTSLCPKTNQPDFAKIFINYIASDKMVESKSLKLYLFSFRNHGDFHEDCIQKICNDLKDLMQPKYLEVVGEFTPRGGLAIFPYSSTHNGEKTYQDIYTHRLSQYAPGKYSMELGRPY